MVRSKLPGGRLTAAQYLAHDDIATQHGNGTLRITTRQGIQFHGVVKGHLRDTIRELNHALVTTFGACGDVVRNVMCCPAPSDDPKRLAVQRFADRAVRGNTAEDEGLPPDLGRRRRPIVADEEDPLYGATYLPRKFKVAIAFAGDNCMDIFTNDAGPDRVVRRRRHAGGLQRGRRRRHGRDPQQGVDVCPPRRRRRLRRARARGRGDQGDRDGAPRFRRPHRPQARAAEVRAARMGPREVPAGTAVARARSRSSRRGRCRRSWSTITSAGTSTARTRGASACRSTADASPTSAISASAPASARWSAASSADVQLTAQQNILLSGIRAADREAVEARARRAWHRHRRQDQRPAAQQPGLPGAADVRPGHQRGRARAAAGARRPRAGARRCRPARASRSCSA